MKNSEKPTRLALLGSTGSIGQQALEMMLLISAPMLLTALAVGLLVSVLQAATQINEATLSFIPKLVAMFLVLVVTGPWMLSTFVDYMQRLLSGIPGAIG